MKIALSLTFALIVLFSLPSVGQSFEKGTNVVNIGIGFGSSLGGRGTQTPAISASYEHGIWEVGDDFGIISLGGYAGFKSYKYRYSDGSDRWTYAIIGFRGAFHYVGFTNLPKLDVYGGAMVSYNHLTYSGSSLFGGTYGSGAGATGFIGGRWYFTDNIAAYTELGYGVAHLNVGVAFKF